MDFSTKSCTLPSLSSIQTPVLSCKSKGLGNKYNYNPGQSKERIITDPLNEVSELLSVKMMSGMVLGQRGVLVNWLRDAVREMLLASLLSYSISRDVIREGRDPLPFALCKQPAQSLPLHSRDGRVKQTVKTHVTETSVWRPQNMSLFPSCLQVREF